MGMGWLPPGEYGKVACPLCKHGWVVESPFSNFLRVTSLSSITSHLRSEWWKSRNTRPCPSCGARIRKNQGCPHVTCRAATCHHEFCWFCLLPWAIHNPLLCLLWLLRYIGFWLFAVALMADLPAEYAIVPTLGLWYAIFRRVSNVMSTLALDSYDPDRSLRQVQLLQVVLWATFPLLVWWIIAAPFFWRSLLIWLIWLLAAAFALLILVIVFQKLLLFFVMLAIDAFVFYHLTSILSVARVVMHYFTAFFIQSLTLVLLPIGLVIYIITSLPRGKTIYAFNMFSNGLTLLRFWLIMAVLQVDVERSASTLGLLSIVEWFLDLAADTAALLAEKLVNPLYCVAFLSFIALIAFSFIAGLEATFYGRSKMIVRVSLGLTLLAFFYFYSPLPLAEPTALSFFYRQKVRVLWHSLTSHAVFKSLLTSPSLPSTGVA